MNVIVEPIQGSKPFQVAVSTLQIVQPLHDYFEPRKAKRAAVANLKRKLKQALVVLAAITTLNAAEVNLQWDANPTAQNVGKYTVYELGGATPTKLMDSTTTSAKLVNVVAGKHTYAVTASNIWGESAQSASVSTPDPATPPSNTRIITIAVTVQ